MKPSALYRLEIAPLVILPLGRSPLFSYLSAAPVATGSYVSVSFGTRTVPGVVFACAPLPGPAPTWMKSAGETIEKAFLTPEQLELAEYISEEYFTPLGKTLKHFLPKRTLARKKKPEKAQAIQTLRSSKEESAILKVFLALPEETPGYMDTSAVPDPYRLFAHFAKQLSSEKRQSLFLVPEITLLPELEAAFRRYFPAKKIAVLHSKLADGPYFAAWESIRSGEAAVILATRQGLFAPFKHLGLVTLIEEQDESYKQWDMSPRYDGRRVAKHLAASHNATLLLTGATESVESYHHLREKHSIPLTKTASAPALGNALEIVNLRLERFRKNYSPLSQALIDALQTALGRKAQALLYIHRQGMQAFSVCEHCKNIFRCPDSGHALSNNKDGTFRCLACSYKTRAFPSCPSCGHLSFRHIGFGTERVEREVARLFPGARVARVDGSTMRTPGSAQALYEKASRNGIDILIGTQMILKGPALPKLALIGMIDADSLLSFADFRADEKLFHILARAAKQVGHAGQGGKVIVQTFHPESAFFQRIAALDAEAFLQQTLTEREDLWYPPFSRLIAIACTGKTEKEADAAAEKLAASLRELLPQGDRAYRLSAPQPAKKQMTRKTFESSLLLRIPADTPLPAALRSLFQKTNASIIIDVDPLSFF
ncbi:MAG: primosomal protein N' [Candidatus Moranbacteria bacterium RIFCSPHIGHO2_01_FULL_54_31]|nr:MAG: primosomal protein N' [Candidatus Moranbacteria bacterium RIFCSPHIGHO2_01_FULL_54_31]